MSPEDRASRAISIRMLLEDPNTQEAFAAVKADIVAEWERTFDRDERENLWRAINTIERVKTWLLSSASSDLTALRRAK
jgi:hypothetical protein